MTSAAMFAAAPLAVSGVVGPSGVARVLLARIVSMTVIVVDLAAFSAATATISTTIFAAAVASPARHAAFVVPAVTRAAAGVICRVLVP